MLKQITTALALITSSLAVSQVGIQTQTPHASADLDLGSENKALFLNRVANPETDIANPQEGMVLYDATLNCIRVYQGEPAKWSDCLAGAPVTAPTNLAGTGSLSGKMCFDVVELFISNECGTIESRTAQRADFLQTATNTQDYTFTPTGTVSNVRFVYVNTNGQVIRSLTGGNTGNGISAPVTATVTYYNNLNTTARGLSKSAALTADIYVIYNDNASNTGTDRQLKLTARVQDCSCCGAMISPTVWKEFLCHNLGADVSLDPHAPAVGIQGSYIQWGRRGPVGSTGDSRIDWQTAGNTANFAAAPTASDANAGTIAGWSTANAVDNSWRTAGGAKTADDPCPIGYRVPTSAEWTGVQGNNAVSRTGTWTSGNTEYGSALHYGPNASAKQLTLPAAGYRNSTGGALSFRGDNGYYWSSTDYVGSTSYYIAFTYNNVGTYNVIRRQGMSVRCIAE